MEHFDASEVREIEIDDKDYPELLKSNKKTTESYPCPWKPTPEYENRCYFWKPKTTEQALDAAYRIGKMLAEHGYTIVVGLAQGCDDCCCRGCTFSGWQRYRCRSAWTQITSKVIQKNLLRKSLLQAGQSFLSILTTSQKCSQDTIYDAMQLSLGFPKQRSLSPLRNDRDRLRPQTTL